MAGLATRNLRAGAATRHPQSLKQDRFEAKRFDQKRSCLEQDRFGLNDLAQTETWQPKRESCSIYGFESKIHVP